MAIKIKGLLGKKAGDAESAVTVVSFINLVLAALALFKDVFLASYLGTSVEADAFLLAFFVPDNVGINLLASALGIACIPVFSRLLVEGDAVRLDRAVSASIIIYSAAAVILTAAFYLAGEYIVNGLGAGMAEGPRRLSLELYYIFLPLVAFPPAIYIAMAVLQVNGRFTVPALAPVLYNLVFLTAVLYLYLGAMQPQKGVYVLAASLVAGIAAMGILVWSAAGRYRIRLLTRIRLAEWAAAAGDLREILRLLFPYILILLTSQMVYAVERYLASGLEVGSIAGLNYAFRMAQFPLWVFVSAVSVVAFPSMSRATGLGRLDGLKNTLVKSLGLVFVITLPLAICLFVLREPAVSTLLQRGSFDYGSVRITSGILAGYSLSIVFQGVSMICLRAYLALGNYYAPLLATVFSAGINIALDFILVEFAGSAGLGYGAAAGALANAVLMSLFLSSRLGLDLFRHAGRLARILAANLPVLLVAALFYKAWGLVGAGMASRLGYALGVVAVALPVYIASLRILKIYGCKPEDRV